MIDFLIPITLVVALTLLLVFQNWPLAIGALILGMGLAIWVRLQGSGRRIKGFGTGRGVWKATCPKCQTTVNAKSAACKNCGAHRLKLYSGKKGKGLMCARCDAATPHLVCPGCSSNILERFWK